LEPSAAQAIAITVHELSTNSAKYGSLSKPNGQIEFKWVQEADGLLILRWREIGGPTVQIPSRQGFGSRVIERMIGQLKGNAHFDWRPEGLVCEITLRV
jgi:two-component sensor histidine kinase